MPQEDATGLYSRGQYRGHVNPIDDAYFAAVESGNDEELQELVDSYARDAGYDLSHRRGDAAINTSMHVILFVKGMERNRHYGVRNYLLKSSDLPDVPEWVKEWTRDHYTYSEYEGGLTPKDIINSAEAWDSAEFVSCFWNENENRLLNEGLFGFNTPDGAVVFDPLSAPIKSTSSIAYDSSGNIVPLTERFDKNKA